MGRASRITISLPTSLLHAMDEELARDDESRSAVLRRLVEQALRDAQEREDVERWVRSYREQPQTEEEFGWVDRVAAEALGQESWQ
jgi:metal-responsive CopG/Arc/MetJ family transcriptional regulator